MCVGFPGKVVAVKGKTAVVEIFGVKREVDAFLAPNIKPGDYVIVHAGMIISKIDEEDYRESVKIFEEISRVIP